MGLIQQLAERLAESNVYAARGLAREDRTIDVDEDDFKRDGWDVQDDDDAAGTHDA